MTANNSKQHRILIVDDVIENLDILKETLKQDYKIIAALDGEKALTLAHSNNCPDLILLDIVMPGTDGYEVCRRLKANDATKNIPVVFLTALTEEKNEAKGLELGAVDYITKPFNPDLVKTRVRNHIELKRHRDHLEELVENRTVQLKLANEKLKDASLDTIYRLARAAEFKDEDTGAHIQRMSLYAAAISRRMGMDAAEIESILYAVPMHDIGKIGIPDRILMKPGKLTGEEFEIMKQHTIIGAKILENSGAEYIQLAEMVALTHHEKWDGSGYPKGLKELEIPMVGCITAVSDVFDALTTKRPYKDPFPIERCFDIIQNGKSSHFHPRVVDCFFDAKDEILSIKEKYQDNAKSPFSRLKSDIALGENSGGDIEKVLEPISKPY